MDRPTRNVIQQRFTPYALDVTSAKAIPLYPWGRGQQLTQQLYDAFVISVPKAAANGIFLGDASIDPALVNGLEILPGIPIMLSIDNERQLYEIQSPIVDGDPVCRTPEAIPFVSWNLTTIYVRAVANVRVGVIIFQAAFL